MRVIKASAIYTMDERSAIVEAIAFEQGKIVAVGALVEVMQVAGEHPEVLDLGEQAVVPGFIDAHLHLSFGAVYQGAIDVGPASAPSIDALLTKLTENSATQPPGSWVIGFGYDELKLREKRHPTRHDLDKAFPDRPAFLMHFTCHEGVANSRALELAQISRASKDPLGGVIVKDKKGNPNGHLLENAMGPVEVLASKELLARDERAFMARIKSYEEMLFAFGVTRIADLVVPPEMEALYRLLHAEGLLRMPIVMMPVGSAGYLNPPLDRLGGARTGEGHETLRVGPMKLFFDGANSCGICLSFGQLFGTTLEFAKLFVKHRSFSFLKDMRAISLRLGRDLHLHAGACYYPDVPAARSNVTKVTAYGFGVAVHAVGNEAVLMAVQALQGQQHPASQPLRIEHAGFLAKETARRAADAGIMLVMQPHFISQFGDGTVPKIPGLALIGLRTALDAGCVIAGSSDAPVTAPDPLLALRSAVTRRVGEAVFLPEEAVSAEEVLQMYTRNAARAIGCLDVTGSLEVGKRADFVVLSADPCQMTPSRLEEVTVRQTFLAGEVVYSKG
jgi:predicted amidohydrolase YtcJ